MELTRKTYIFIVFLLVILIISIISLIILLILSKFMFKDIMITKDNILYAENPDKQIYIPKRIIQTHKSLDFIQNSFFLKKCQNSWTKFIDQGIKYKFYDDQECIEFLENNFKEEVLEIYNLLPLNVMRADLFRYCEIYINGGIYADADCICFGNKRIKKLFEPGAKLILFSESNQVYFNQYVFAAEPKHPLFKLVIQMIIDKVKSNNGIINMNQINAVLETTGPGIFTEAVFKYFESLNIPIHRVTSFYKGYNENGIFIRPETPELTFPQILTGAWSGGWMNQEKKLRRKLTL